MGVAFHPNMVLDSGEIAGNAGFGNNQKPVTGTLKHGALALPIRGSIALNLYPCIGIGQVEIGNVDSIGR